MDIRGVNIVAKSFIIIHTIQKRDYRQVEIKESTYLCPVRFGMEECPKGWKETLERYDNGIKSCEKDIKELKQELEAGTIHLLLKEATEQLIKMKKVEIQVYRKSIDPDYEFKDLLKIKKGDVIIL